MRFEPLLLLAVLAAPLAAQTTLLAEDFSSLQVPPAGWTEENNGNSVGWELEPAGSGVLWTSDHAFHDDFFGWNDNALVTPALDFSAVSAVSASCQQGVTYASWRDHHYVDVSLDGGNTFIHVADDLALDGISTLVTDLSAYAGINGVKVAWRYTGDYASEWELDDILISSTGPTGPFLSVTNLVAGYVATIRVQFATPGGLVRSGYSLAGGGPVSTPAGALLLSPPYFELPVLVADASGSTGMTAPVPPAAAGAQVWLHAFDLGSATFSTGVAATIQ